MTLCLRLKSIRKPDTITALGERPHESGSVCFVTKSDYDAIVKGQKAIVLYGFLQ